MTTLVAAYQRWVSLAPFSKKMPAHEIPYMRHTGEFTTIREATRFDGDCCLRSHHTSRTGGPLPDSEVCERERAWREYVKLRDHAESIH